MSAPRTFWYVATPYSKYEGGLEAAFIMASQVTARLVKAGVPVFCPIAHTHPVAVHGGLDPLDHGIWLPADRPFMDMACGLIMVRAPGWEQSYGMRVEREAFDAAGKPVVWMDPEGPIPAELFPEPTPTVSMDVRFTIPGWVVPLLKAVEVASALAERIRLPGRFWLAGHARALLAGLAVRFAKAEVRP